MSARINEQIGAREVRVVDDEGTQVGVLPRADAIAYAAGRGLDLVEVAGDAVPPVCKVTEYGRWRYAEERRLRAGRRNQVHGAPKEVRLRPWISEHDYAWRRAQIDGFLRGRAKVKLVVRLRGRELERPELARDLIRRFAEDVREVGHLEGAANLEGRTVTVVLAPNGAAA